VKKAFLFVLALASLAVMGAAAFAPQANAQGYYDGPPRYGRYDDRRYYDDRYAPRPYYRPRPRDNCRALIRASGLGNVLPGIARANAIRAWQRETFAVYGRQYSYSAAKAKSINCVPSPSGIALRCTASGRPCP
jgi:hypothetical protein